MHSICTHIPFWLPLVSISQNVKCEITHILPSLTSVGATTGNDPEVAASLSSGGFSNVFATPSFQTAEVAAYLETIDGEYQGLFNASGRGFPDVSTQGQNFVISSGSYFGLVDGTSCASPTFASVIALINDALLSAGKSRLGWLNPWLYSNATSALNDVTSGSNPGCDTSGFPAEAGWDPVGTRFCSDKMWLTFIYLQVTGLGTPNFTALMAAAGL